VSKVVAPRAPTRSHLEGGLVPRWLRGCVYTGPTRSRVTLVMSSDSKSYRARSRLAPSHSTRKRSKSQDLHHLRLLRQPLYSRHSRSRRSTHMIRSRRRGREPATRGSRVRRRARLRMLGVLGEFLRGVHRVGRLLLREIGRRHVGVLREALGGWRWHGHSGRRVNFGVSGRVSCRRAGRRVIGAS
jgi:hypothetical protein